VIDYKAQIVDWMEFMPLAVEAVLAGDSSKLVFVSGLTYDNDLTFLDSPLASEAWLKQLTEYESSIVIEAHIYTWAP